MVCGQLAAEHCPMLRTLGLSGRIRGVTTDFSFVALGTVPKPEVNDASTLRSTEPKIHESLKHAQACVGTIARHNRNTVGQPPLMSPFVQYYGCRQQCVFSFHSMSVFANRYQSRRPGWASRGKLHLLAESPSKG